MLGHSGALEIICFTILKIVGSAEEHEGGVGFAY